MGWHTKGRAHALEIPGDVASVRMITTIHDTGVDYEVRAVLRSIAASPEGAYGRGDDEVRVWSESVTYGQTDANVSGGTAFVAMAREQERVAREVWAASYNSEPRPPKYPPDTEYE